MALAVVAATIVLVPGNAGLAAGALAAGLAGGAWLLADRLVLRRLARAASDLQQAIDGLTTSPTADGITGLVHALARQRDTARREAEAAVTAATAAVDEKKRILESILRDLDEGIVVCSPDHRILLSNAAADSLLGQRTGLNRSVFDALSREPIVHALDSLMAAGDGAPSVPLMCTAAATGVLLRGQLRAIPGQTGSFSGYVLSLADVGRPIAEMSRRDALLRDTAATLADLAPRLAADVDRTICVALADQLSMASRGDRALAQWLWPTMDVHSVDLLTRAARRLEGSGLTVTLTGQPMWLHGDGHALVVAIEQSVRDLGALGPHAFDLSVRPDGTGVAIDITWSGPEVGADGLAGLLRRPIAAIPGTPTLEEVAQRHGGAVQPSPTGLSLPAIAARAAGPRRQLPPRPEFYDFDGAMFAPIAGDLDAVPLRRATYVVFDTETTGLNPTQGDEIIAVGAVRIVNGRILTGETFSRLINPGRPIPPQSTRFHDITDAMVADAPPAAVALAQFRAFIGDALVIAHNAAFDLKFLSLKEAACGCRFDMRALDTLLLSRFLYPDRQDHDLDAIAARLGVVVGGRHSALGDAMATAAIFLRLTQIAETRGLTTVGALLRASNMTRAIALGQRGF